jgi:hypothetical protein
MQDFTVQAKDRQIAFTGELIGSASTQAPGKDRWAEVEIYRTKGGQYVVAGCGRTLKPGETDRHWAHSSGTPSGAIEVLYLFDNDDIRYLPNVAKRALAEAARRDSVLREAQGSFVEHVA